MKTTVNEKEKQYVENIVKKYNGKEETKLDQLRNLDFKAKKGARIFAYVFGIIGSLVLGLGMCMAMKIILADLMWLGIVIGLVGIVMVSVNYSIYKKLLAKGRSKYADRIKELSAEILNQ